MTSNEPSQTKRNVYDTCDPQYLRQLREAAGMDHVVLARSACLSVAQVCQLETDDSDNLFYSDAIKRQAYKRLLMILGAEPPTVEVPQELRDAGKVAEAHLNTLDQIVAMSHQPAINRSTSDVLATGFEKLKEHQQVVGALLLLVGAIALFVWNGMQSGAEIESAASITDRGTQITSSIADNCITVSVRLTPHNDIPPDAYTLYVNDVPYTDFDSGERSYPVGSVIKLVYNNVNNVCGVVLNDTSYASSTNVTLVNGVSYIFKMYNYNYWSNVVGATYCQEGKTYQTQSNSCGNTRPLEIFPCSTKCTATTYSDACSGVYGQNVTRTFYYACNGQATGTVTQLTCGGTCTSIAQDWKVTSTYCKPGYCNKFNELTQSNPCAPNPGATQEVALTTNSCDCGESCDGTFDTTYCDPNNVGSQITVTKYRCSPQSVVSSTSRSCITGCGASLSQNWVSVGNVYCSSCVKKQDKQQMNPCADEYLVVKAFNATDGNTTCECGQECKGEETYYFCDGTQGKTRYTVQRYVCPPNTYTTTPQVVGTCLANTCGVSYTPQYQSKGYDSCYYQGGYPCTTGPVYQDINYCSDTYNDYFIEVSGNKLNVGGPPSQGACNTDSNCQNTGVNYCSNGNRVYERYQANPCSNASCPPVVVSDPTCAPTCYIYNIIASSSSGTSGSYTGCSSGSTTTFNFSGGPGNVGQVCARSGTVSVSSGTSQNTGTTCT